MSLPFILRWMLGLDITGSCFPPNIHSERRGILGHIKSSIKKTQSIHGLPPKSLYFFKFGISLKMKRDQEHQATDKEIISHMYVDSKIIAHWQSHY